MWVKTQREEFQKKPMFVDKFKQFIRSTTRDTFKTKEEETIVSQFLNDMFLPATLNQIKANFMVCARTLIRAQNIANGLG